jgi:hypothetical protein
MRARVPLDVDLEDRLVFGLTPQRFGYVTVAALAAMASWHALPFVGGPLAVLCLAAGAALGWLRWHGRGLDHWVVAAALWVVRTRRVEVDPGFASLFVSSTSSVVARVRVARPQRRRPTQLPPSRLFRRPPPAHHLHVLSGGDADP